MNRSFRDWARATDCIAWTSGSPSRNTIRAKNAGELAWEGDYLLQSTRMLFVGWLADAKGIRELLVAGAGMYRWMSTPAPTTTTRRSRAMPR